MIKMDAELWPCPFCGGKAEIKFLTRHLDDYTTVYVECSCCNCQTAEFLVERVEIEAGKIVRNERQPKSSVEQAIEMWNRRKSLNDL